MKTHWKPLAVLAVTLGLVATGGAVQETTAPSTPDPPVEVDVDIDLDIDVDGEVVQIGRSYTLPAGKRVESAVVIAGTARIEGEIEQDLVVVAGAATLAGTARVGGDVVVVGGTGDLQPGAEVGGDLVAVGSGLKVPEGFSPGGDQVSVGAFELGDQFANAAPWLTRGMLWGRPIVPDLPWMWAFVAVFALLFLLINLVFDGPVRACTDTLGRKPLTTGLAGFLTLLLISPVSFILTVSVVGLALVPFLWLAFMIVGLIGNVAAARWIGSRVLPEESPHNRLQAARSLGIGLAAIILVGMVPVAGLTAWALVSLLGLGAAATALVAGLRRENPPSPAPTPPPIAEPGSDASTGGAAEPSSSDTAPAASPPQGEHLASFPRATFLRRLGALLLDLFLVTAITLAFFEIHPGRSFVLLLVYRVALWSWKATTVGGIICGLRVVRTDGKPLAFTDALVRGLASILSAVAAGLGWLWILWDPERQAWHDKIARTVVVRVPAGWPL
ncbi:MAG: RDD family protein [Acidobacteriota bacterium]|nr:RDD family protein [Acidobacteriota bacterium]